MVGAIKFSFHFLLGTALNLVYVFDSIFDGYACVASFDMVLIPKFDIPVIFNIFIRCHASRWIEVI